MCVLSAKEAYALEHQLDAEELSVCRAAQKHFLREHLGRWTPAFARRLARTAGEDALGRLAAFTGALITSECARFGVRPGSEDLLLRPVDEAAETLCASCSAAPLMPGVARWRALHKRLHFDEDLVEGAVFVAPGQASRHSRFLIAGFIGSARKL